MKERKRPIRLLKMYQIMVVNMTFLKIQERKLPRVTVKRQQKQKGIDKHRRMPRERPRKRLRMSLKKLQKQTEIEKHRRMPREKQRQRQLRMKLRKIIWKSQSQNIKKHKRLSRKIIKKMSQSQNMKKHKRLSKKIMMKTFQSQNMKKHKKLSRKILIMRKVKYHKQLRRSKPKECKE